jgi:hypothetical protein
MANGGDIIIKGGSVDLTFDDNVYKKDDPNKPRKHGNPKGKITQIVVVDENGTEKCNSGVSPSGLKWTITVTAT